MVCSELKYQHNKISQTDPLWVEDEQEVRVEGCLDYFTAQCMPGAGRHTHVLEAVQHCQSTNMTPRGTIQHRFYSDQVV